MSQPFWPVSAWESKRSTRAFGSSAFMRYDLGFIDLDQKTLQPTDNPFGPGL
jgi:hypothetical protein